jgi:hypothetical protein
MMIHVTVSLMQAQAYHPDFGQVINYEFSHLPDDPDEQVRWTISKLCRYLVADASSPIIQEFAEKALAMNPADPIAGVWALVRQSLRFQQDETSAMRLAIDDPRKRDAIEVLIRPVDQALLINLRGYGFEDCDGYELFAGCLLYRLGIPCSLVTVAAEPDAPKRFSHVYIACYPDGRDTPGGRRIAIDCSHGLYPGWECPNAGRLHEWPIGPYYFDCLGLGLALGALAILYVASKVAQRRKVAA